jgi:hypothetical protein
MVFSSSTIRIVGLELAAVVGLYLVIQIYKVKFSGGGFPKLACNIVSYRKVKNLTSS